MDRYGWFYLWVITQTVGWTLLVTGWSLLPKDKRPPVNPFTVALVLFGISLIAAIVGW